MTLKLKRVQSLFLIRGSLKGALLSVPSVSFPVFRKYDDKYGLRTSFELESTPCGKEYMKIFSRQPVTSGGTTLRDGYFCLHKTGS